MMQFTRSAPAPPPPPPHPDGLGLCLDKDAPKPSLHLSRPWPGIPTSSSSAKSLGTPSCMEQLLVHCANAIEGNDATLAQQILWVLNNIAPPDGDSNQRLTAAFLRALIVRASKTGSCKMLTAVNAAPADTDLALQVHHRFSAVNLASFVDLTPWHRFGYAAANAAIAEAVEGRPVVHIVDLTTTHCMQMPTLIDLLAKRPDGPPFIRLTVPSLTTTTSPPVLDLSHDELGSRLVKFARSRNVAMEFRAIPSDPNDAFDSLIEQLRVQRLASEGEAMIVNCQMLLHYIPEETVGATTSAAMDVNSPMLSHRTMFLKAVRSLEPTLVTVVDEDADFTACDVVGRLRSAFNYLWIPYDAVDTFLPGGSEQRWWYEAGVNWKIENVIAQEGRQRVERLEPKGRWSQRMRAAGFRSVGFTEEAAGEVKSMLDEHAAGWGLKKEEVEEDDLVLTWKGHNVVFATAWVPS